VGLCGNLNEAVRPAQQNRKNQNAQSSDTSAGEEIVLLRDLSGVGHYM